MLGYSGNYLNFSETEYLITIINSDKLWAMGNLDP